MRIAVTYENGQIFQHFGHTETFKIYDVEEGKVVHSEVVDTNGSGHGALAGVLNAAGTVADWVAQFSFGFYSLMLTSLLLGLIVMVLYKPRTWCTFCPMGTMTQGICKLKNNEKK